jgi:hypothetical protein
VLVNTTTCSEAEQGTQKERGGGYKRASRHQGSRALSRSVLLIERDALLRVGTSQVSHWIPQTEASVRDMLERRSAQNRSPLTRNSTNPILPSLMLAFGPRVDMGIMNWKETRPCASVRIDCEFAQGERCQNRDEMRKNGRIRVGTWNWAHSLDRDGECVASEENVRVFVAVRPTKASAYISTCETAVSVPLAPKVRDGRNARVPERLFALKDLEHVLVVRVVHLRKQMTCIQRSDWHKPGQSPSHHFRQRAATYLCAAHRSDALQPKQRHLFVVIVLLLLLIHNALIIILIKPSRSCLLSPLLAFPASIPFLTTVAILVRIRGGERDGEFFGRGGDFEEGVVEPVGLFFFWTKAPPSPASAR